MFRPFVPKGDVIILEVPDDDRLPCVIDDVSLLSQAFLRALALSNVAYGNDRQQWFVAPIVNESTAIVKDTLPIRPKISHTQFEIAQIFATKDARQRPLFQRNACAVQVREVKGVNQVALRSKALLQIGIPMNRQCGTIPLHQSALEIGDNHTLVKVLDHGLQMSLTCTKRILRAFTLYNFLLELVSKRLQLLHLLGELVRNKMKMFTLEIWCRNNRRRFRPLPQRIIDN